MYFSNHENAGGGFLLEFIQSSCPRTPQRLRTRLKQSVVGLLNEENLAWCFDFLRKDAAPGVDRVDYAGYQENLDSNIHDLVERLKTNRYRAKLVRRRYIPKLKGKMRHLGIPATEDKLVQVGVAKILEAIYNRTF